MIAADIAEETAKYSEIIDDSYSYEKLQNDLSGKILEIHTDENGEIVVDTAETIDNGRSGFDIDDRNVYIHIDSGTIENIIYYYYFSSAGSFVEVVAAGILGAFVTWGISLALAVATWLVNHILEKVIFQPYLDEANRHGYTDEEAYRILVRAAMAAFGLSNGYCITYEYAICIHVHYEIRTFWKTYVIDYNYYIYHYPWLVYAGAQ